MLEQDNPVAIQGELEPVRYHNHGAIAKLMEDEALHERFGFLINARVRTAGQRILCECGKIACRRSSGMKENTCL